MGRIRAALATLGTAPWRRAPRLLWRRPGVLATVAGATVVLAASAAAVPLFLSSAGSEATAVQAGERCPRDTGAIHPTGFTASELRDPPPDPFAPLADTLGPTASWARFRTTLVRPDGSRAPEMPILARDDFLDHVEVVDGSPGPGLWISDRAATITRLERGDVATIDGAMVESEISGTPFEIPFDDPAELPIAGVYRDMGGPAPDDDYWCAHADLLLSEVPGDLPDPLLLADPGTMAELVGALGIDAVPGAWEAPLRTDDLTPTEADALVTDLACGSEVAPDLAWCSDIEVAADGTITRRIEAPTVEGPFGRFTPRADELEYDDADAFVSAAFSSHLPFVTERTRAIQGSVAGGVVPVAAFAAVAGIGLVAAAASLWLDRRRREVTLLSVRGVSPAGLGLKAVLELAVALLVGSTAGVGLAYGLVVWLGPSTVVEPAAIGWAAAGGAAALLVAAAVVGLVVATRARRQLARRRRWDRLSAVPWEILAGAMAVLSYRRLGEWGVPVAQGAEVTTVDVLALLFPLVFLLAAVALAMRLLTLALPRLRAASRRWPPALYLAVRRVARHRVAVTGLVAASAVAAGVLAYAATLNRSLAATLDAKAQAFVGSDVAVGLPPGEHLAPTLSQPATTVSTYWYAWIETDRREGVVVLAIDPDTFRRAAFWDPAFSDVPLGELLDRLSAPAADGRVPAVVVGADAPTVTEAAITGGPTTRFTIEQMADVEAFPGMKRQTPTVVVAASALDDFTPHGATTEAWIRGDHDDVLAGLEDAGAEFRETRRFGEVVDRASFLTVSWTFGFMQSLGVAAGVLTVGGTAVYLDARRRGRVLGYAFARRMGLARGAHRRAMLVELTAGVVVGCWLGVGIALTGAWLAYRRIDPVPDFRPGPLLRPATTVAAALALVALVVAGLAAILAQRRTDRDDPVEVLRAGT
ncbi:MAG TPA: FtsX-like permease family protein [Acidimicrobiales bacterium]|nr:FtsX-like permease family protein [Acidimicrobiales bacterium]